tara:strand:- start:1591 stop:1845 length:255 start_codon:yes stop_codon:yes gene_type:complete
MNLLEEILSSYDDALFCEEADSETLTVSKNSPGKKRKRHELEEGEIEEWYTVCTGFFFDVTIMKKVPGCVECHNGKFCGRPRKV